MTKVLLNIQSNSVIVNFETVVRYNCEIVITVSIQLIKLTKTGFKFVRYSHEFVKTLSVI